MVLGRKRRQPGEMKREGKCVMWSPVLLMRSSSRKNEGRREEREIKYTGQTGTWKQ